MKKIYYLFLFALLPLTASADDSGTCGDNVTWSWVTSTKNLTISGTGWMKDYGYFPDDDIYYLLKFRK